MSEIDSYPLSVLEFEVISTRTVDNPTKHTVYKVNIVKEGSSPDNHPCTIERRYTEFLDLYTKLCQEFPSIFSTQTFPKKAMVGNFSPETISLRKAGFEALLRELAFHEKVRESPIIIDFFHQKELTESLKLIQDQKYNQAVSSLENSFYLLNKLLTPRHPRLLRLLCLLVACCYAAGAEQTRHFAMTAVKRFEAVSDTDLLRYYVPLLQLCAGLVENSDKQLLEERLGCMKRRGIKVDGCPPLLDAVVADLS